MVNMVPEATVQRRHAHLKRKAESADKRIQTAAKQHKRSLEGAKEALAKQRRLKNEQAEKKRKAEAEVEKGRKQIQRIESGAAWTKNARQFLPEHMSARITGHEEDALKREEEIKAWVEKEVKARVHEIETKFKVQEAAASTSSAKFLDVLGRKNQRYNLIVIELGMELMSQRLSAPQAEQALRSILGKVYADKKEGTDYRVPPARMFRDWRRMLHPICKWISLRALTQAEFKQWWVDREKGRAADKAVVDTAAGAAAAAVSAAAPVAAAAPEGLRPAPLPSHKSSRQILEIQLAAAVRNNCEFYVEYIDEMALDAEANKLITKSSIGLRDMYVKAGINARAFRYVVFFAPAVFVVHQLATRPDVWGVLECLRVALVRGP